jgi:hypothetical protein
MKIRWTRHSLRLRISPSEMDVVLGGGDVSEVLALPGVGGRWSASLAAGDETGIALENGSLRLTLSRQDRARLAVPDAEGVYFETEGETPVGYYVEKDFPCAHPRAAEAAEPPSETFAAPPGFEERKAP